MDYFDPLYFAPAYFGAASAPQGRLGPLGPAASPYFACDYFDLAYFDTDCAPASTGGRGGGRRVRIHPPPVLDDDELLALI